MPCARMRTIYMRGLLWLYLLQLVHLVMSLEPGFLDFDNLPDTNFSCVGKVIGGYYADLETNCQMFHVCTIGQLDEPMDIRFLCLNGTVFDQETRVCERIDEVDCAKSEHFYSLNLELYGNTQPSVPEETETEPPIIIKPTTTTTTTTTPKPTTSKATTTTKVLHFPISGSDIRFNPEEINISLNPGAAPNIKTLSYQSQVFNDKKVVVTTHTSYPERLTQRPITKTTPYGFTYRTEPSYQYHVPYRQYRNQFKTTLVPTTRKYLTYRTSKPPVLPTLPLTFSSPAPFSLGHHDKRYTEHQNPPRIIISASASVSDDSGRRLNYSLGTIGVSPILEQPPRSYDEYKEHDVVLDPFYHDVPKVKSRKKRQINSEDQAAVDVLRFLFEWYSKQSSTLKVPIVPEDITEINEQLAPIVEKPEQENRFNIVGDVISVTEPPKNFEPEGTTIVPVVADDYVDDNYEGAAQSAETTTSKVMAILQSRAKAHQRRIMNEQRKKYTSTLDGLRPKIKGHLKNGTKHIDKGESTKNEKIEDISNVSENIDPTTQTPDIQIYPEKAQMDELEHEKHYLEENKNLFDKESKKQSSYLLDEGTPHENKESFMTTTPINIDKLEYERPLKQKRRRGRIRYLETQEARILSDKGVLPLEETKKEVISNNYEQISETETTADNNNRETSTLPSEEHTTQQIGQSLETEAPEGINEAYENAGDQIEKYLENEETKLVTDETTLVEDNFATEQPTTEQKKETYETDLSENVDVSYQILQHKEESVERGNDENEATEAPTEPNTEKEDFSLHTTVNPLSTEEFELTTLKSEESTTVITEEATEEPKTEVTTLEEDNLALMGTTSTTTEVTESFEDNAVPTETTTEFFETSTLEIIQTSTPKPRTSRRKNSSYRRPTHRHRFSAHPDRRKVEETSKKNSEDEVAATDAPLFKSANPTQAETTKHSHTTPVYRKPFIFNCFGKAINRFYSDPRDCRLFHYCTSGYTKNQLLDMKFVCDLGTYFDDEKLICTKVKPERCL